MPVEPVLKMRNIDKRFAGVHALKSFNFECYPGEVHVLMGENGAGKSTLLKILTGNHCADTGDICINGEKADINRPIDAINHGIAMIYQEIHLCHNMTVAENIFRGEELRKPPFNFVDFRQMERRARELLDRLDMDIAPGTYVGDISIAQQQMVEIAGALSRDARILILDEATASLTEKESQALFRTIKTLVAKNVAVIYVSHRMNETFEIGDRVTIMRDGEYIATRKIAETSVNELVEMMVGRSIDNFYICRRAVGGEPVMEVKNFTNSKLKNVSVTVRKGEILGFSGLVGAGRTELARAIFGLDGLEAGELFIEGRKVRIRRAADAIRAGIGLVPEDRKHAGLVLMNTVGFNLTLTVLRKFIKGMFVNRRKEREIIDTYQNSLSIKMSGSDQPAMNLSGGNQQKIVISKWLATEPKFLIMDEPTRGIDVGAKHEIYELMYSLTQRGISILFISSDLPEIINLSSRVVIMREGEVAGVLDSREEELTQVKVMSYATGGCLL